MSAEFDPYEAGLFVSPLRITALQLNELYKELLSVGFKKQEALFLISQVLLGSIVPAYGDEDLGYDDYQDESDGQDLDDEDGDFI